MTSRPSRSQQPQRPRSRRPGWRWPAATAAGVVVLAAVIFAVMNRPQGPAPATLVPSGVARGVTPTGEPTLGSEKARVVIDEFGDFQCPYCGEFVRQTEPRIIAAYVTTGKARIVWHTLAFVGPESELTGRAAWCAQQRGKFWEYFALLYQHQDGENTGTFNAARLERWAGDAGMDRAAFGECLSGDRSLAGIQAGTREGRRLDVHVTPTFFVNGRKATGAPSFEQLSALIDAALAAPR